MITDCLSTITNLIHSIRTDLLKSQTQIESIDPTQRKSGKIEKHVCGPATNEKPDKRWIRRAEMPIKMCARILVYNAIVYNTSRYLHFSLIEK